MFPGKLDAYFLAGSREFIKRTEQDFISVHSNSYDNVLCGHRTVFHVNIFHVHVLPPNDNFKRRESSINYNY